MANLNDKNERPVQEDGSWSIDLKFDDPAPAETPAAGKPAAPVPDDVFSFDIPEEASEGPKKVSEPPKKTEPPKKAEKPAAAAEPVREAEPAPFAAEEPQDAKDAEITVDELLASFSPVKPAAEEEITLSGVPSADEKASGKETDGEPGGKTAADGADSDERRAEKEKTPSSDGGDGKRKTREAAVSAPRGKKAVDESSRKYLVRTAAVLTGICAGVALLLAVIHGATQNVIAQNIEREKNEAILAVFPEGNDIREYKTEDGETVYIVLREGTIVGYCVNTVGSGYIGDISMMVGLNAAHEVSGIRIVDIQETPGTGTRVQSESFLSRFKGVSEEVTIGENVDGITGATFSSRAIAQGVNKALDVDVNLNDAARTIGASLASLDFLMAEPENRDNGDGPIRIAEAGESDTDDSEAEAVEPTEAEAPEPEEPEPEDPEPEEPEPEEPEPEEPEPEEPEPEEPEPEEPEPEQPEPEQPEPEEPEPEQPTQPEPEQPTQPEPEQPTRPEPIQEPVTQPEPEPQQTWTPEPEPQQTWTPEPEPQQTWTPEPEPQTPVVPEPQTPVVPEPQTPVVPEPQTPVVTEPETPVVTEPETPVVTEPETPVVTEPETPVVTEPETPAEPETPVVTEPQTPSEPETPAEHEIPGWPELTEPEPEPGEENPGEENPNPEPEPADTETPANPGGWVFGP